MTNYICIANIWHYGDDLNAMTSDFNSIRWWVNKTNIYMFQEYLFDTKYEQNTPKHSTFSLKGGRYHDVNFVVTGDNNGCRYENRMRWQIGKVCSLTPLGF